MVELDHQYRTRVIAAQIRHYFYGSSLDVPPGVALGSLGGEATVDATLSPYSASLKFDELKIYRFGAGQ